MTKILITALVVAPLALGSTQIQAQAVIGWGGGSFSSLSSCDSSGTSQDCRIVSTTNGTATQVQWGSQSSSVNFYNPSTLTSVDVSFSTFTPANALQIARLDWYNSPTRRLDDSLDVFSVNWSMNVHFDAPTGPDPNGQELFNFTIRNPINPTGDTIYGFALGDLGNLAQSITLNGVTLTNFRYQVTDGAGAGSSWLQNNWWYNDESNYATLSIVADVHAVAPIPEPQTYALMLAGLFLLATYRRLAPRQRLT